MSASTSGTYYSVVGTGVASGEDWGLFRYLPHHVHVSIARYARSSCSALQICVFLAAMFEYYDADLFLCYLRALLPALRTRRIRWCLKENTFRDDDGPSIEFLRAVRATEWLLVAIPWWYEIRHLRLALAHTEGYVCGHLLDKYVRDKKKIPIPI